MRVEVRDAVNENRLLGYLDNPPALNWNGRHLHIAVMPPLSISNLMSQRKDDLTTELDIRKVTLWREWRLEDHGYTKTAFFRTTAPLEDLMGIRNFRLPGENDSEQACRFYNR